MPSYQDQLREARTLNVERSAMIQSHCVAHFKHLKN
jgi:hypothetical protein